MSASVLLLPVLSRTRSHSDSSPVSHPVTLFRVAALPPSLLLLPLSPIQRVRTSTMRTIQPLTPAALLDDPLALLVMSLPLAERTSLAAAGDALSMRPSLLL